jgi:RimJ/RimL family protein N-acetyltransferase
MSKKPIFIDLPEVIETPRLQLQMPKAGYGQELHEAIIEGYADYIKWLNWPPTPPTPEGVEEDCRKHHAEFILRDSIRYIIIEKASNRIIGRCSFPPLQAVWSIPQFGISYFIRKNTRNQGFATETSHALAVLAFRVLEAQKVEIYCDAENIPSQKIPQKLGFTLECTKRGGWPRADNKLADLQTYALFSEKPLPALEIKW